MVEDSLEQSLAPGGAHHLLGRMAGTWKGTAKTWFEPGVLAEESSVEGTVRPVLEGRFVVHEYRGTLKGRPMHGIAVMGHDLLAPGFTVAWVDSFHTGTGTMLSVGKGPPDGDRFSVRGSYSDPGGGKPWGWRTEMALAGEDRLEVIHFNISPEGREARAVEFLYDRVAG